LPVVPAAVFDTAVITDGYLYQLDQHLQRFLTNAAKANIGLPRGMSVEQMRRTILETAAAGCKLNGEHPLRLLAALLLP
jgi:4-amino-4-deoxychorismate lyase